jgi:hypothetical protein
MIYVKIKQENSVFLTKNHILAGFIITCGTFNLIELKRVKVLEIIHEIKGFWVI